MKQLVNTIIKRYQAWGNERIFVQKKDTWKMCSKVDIPTWK